MPVKVVLEMPEEIVAEYRVESKPEPTKEEARTRKYLRENYPAKVQIKFEWPWWASALED